jgi:surface antigen
MSIESFRLLVAVFSAGVGLLFVGGLHLLIARCPRWSRVVAILAAAGITGIGPLALDQSAAAPVALVLFGVGLSLWVVVGSKSLAAVVTAVIALVRRPVIRAAGLGIVGLGLCIGAIAAWGIAEEAATDGDMQFMAELNAKPPLREPSGSAAVVTDRGRPVTVKVPVEARPNGAISATEHRLLTNLNFDSRLIRRADASDQSNCHGWVFTGGRYWVAGDDVERILEDNGYQPTSQPRPGDLAIFREAGKVGHTAVVRAVAEGLPVLVEGKWGWMGVFLHGVGDSCYGTNYTYYRSAREGHLLAGLRASSGTPAEAVGDVGDKFTPTSGN